MLADYILSYARSSKRARARAVFRTRYKREEKLTLQRTFSSQMKKKEIIDQLLLMSTN